MCRITYESVSFWVALASFCVSLVAVWLTRSALSQTKAVAEREQRDWRQRTWFDLYFKANAAYDALDHFQALYPSPASPRWNTPEWEQNANTLMRIFRDVYSVAMVFPKNLVIDKLIEATAGFAKPEVLLSKERLKILLDAVDGVREKAFVDPNVLG
jgi:hypothetical protein